MRRCILHKNSLYRLANKVFLFSHIVNTFFEGAVCLWPKRSFPREKGASRQSLSLEQINENEVLDSIPEKKPLLLDLINYNAMDSVKIDQKANKIRLYNQAVLTYEEMRLEAGIIVLDYTTNEVYAGRIADSLGNLSQKPKFLQAGNEVNPDSIRFNFDTKKASDLEFKNRTRRYERLF